MTDIAQGSPPVPAGSRPTSSDLHTSKEARRRLATRYRSERRFKAYGMGAVLLAATFLVLLLYTVISDGLPAFTYHYLNLPVELTSETVDETDVASADLSSLVRDALAKELPFAESRANRRVRNSLVSIGAPIMLQRDILDDPSLIGSGEPAALLLSDFADLYLKGMITGKTTIGSKGSASPTGTDGQVRILSTADDFSALLASVKAELAEVSRASRDEIEARMRSVGSIEATISSLEERIATASDEALARLVQRKEVNQRDLAVVRAQVEALTREAEDTEARATAVDQREAMTASLPSYLVHINGGVVKVSTVEANAIEGEAYIPLNSDAEARAGSWNIVRVDIPEGRRKFSDKEIAWTDYLAAKGYIEQRFNTVFFSSGASREPEMAGIWGAVVGSLFTMLVTLMLSFPIGVAAAIYLEEFAPKNRITGFIEVNINNLAAVPSIVFGLLGLAMFLNVFGFPRSAPLVGGMVLALMTLPTIIIASRAALKAVPPSIREAALGVGASHIQSVFHHVLPLAMPGIFTGTIIGMAQALGETAPLLMIGMVAFIVDIPGGMFSPSTVLPVQIYMWADFPEPAFQQKTAAAIMVLLGFLISMNAIAIVLRKRFERRW